MAKGKIFYKTGEEINAIQKSCEIVSETLALVAEMLKPGITPKVVDAAAEEYIRSKGGMPAFKGYHGFPSTLCFSLNDCVVHGIPNDRPLEPNDVMSVDCGVQLNGYFGDAAYTFAFNDIDEDTKSLMIRTKESLYLGIEQAIIGKRVGDVSYAVFAHTEIKYGYGVVRDLVGHGVGIQLHEAPDVPNYGKRGNGPLLVEGMVIAIEPMINLGKKNVKVLKDGWSIMTTDGKPSAHFEHTVAIGKHKANILSNHEIIESAVKKNEYLVKI